MKTYYHVICSDNIYENIKFFDVKERHGYLTQFDKGKIFWKLLNKLRNTKSPDSIDNISPKLISDRFLRLLQSKKSPKISPQYNSNVGTPDHKISSSEIDDALKSANKNSPKCWAKSGRRVIY